MRDEPSGNDPKIIWQEQPTELSTMTLKLIHRKARDLHERTRRELLRNVAGLIVVIAICGVGIARAHSPAQWAVFALAVVWGLAGQYVLNRGMRPAALPGDAALSTGLEYYRREVERRFYIFRRALQWSIGPVLVAIGAWIVPVLWSVRNRGLIPNGLPFMLMFALWIVAVFIVRMKQQRELKREMEELNDIESMN
jgi:hypothetical protein